MKRSSATSASNAIVISSICDLLGLEARDFQNVAYTIVYTKYRAIGMGKESYSLRDFWPICLRSG